MRALLGDMDKLQVTSYSDSNGLMWRNNYDNIKEMRYHSPEGEGDKHFMDIYFTDNTRARTFDIVNISFAEN